MPRGRVQDVLRRRLRPGLAGGGARRLVGGVGRVRFRREREVDDRLRQRQFALGRAEPLVGLPALEADGLRLRVGEADVLHRHAGDAPGEEARVLAALQHPREPVERGVGVRAAHRLVQRRDEVVVPVARLVVLRRPALEAARRARRGRSCSVEPPARHLLHEVEKRPPVAVGHRRAAPPAPRRSAAAARRARLRPAARAVRGRRASAAPAPSPARGTGARRSARTTGSRSWRRRGGSCRPPCAAGSRPAAPC